MIRSILAAAVLAGSLSTPLAPAAAQTANSSPTSGTGAGAGNVTRTAPSGSTAIPNPGRSQVGAPTPLEQHEETKGQKDTASICKGC